MWLFAWWPQLTEHVCTHFIEQIPLCCWWLVWPLVLFKEQLRCVCTCHSDHHQTLRCSNSSLNKQTRSLSHSLYRAWVQSATHSPLCETLILI